MRFTQKTALMATLMGVLSLLSANGMADEKLLKETDVQQVAVNLARQTVEGGYSLITVDEFKALQASGEPYVLIDAHPPREFVLGYIDGAKNFGFQSKHSGAWENDLDFEGDASQADYRAALGEDLNKKVVIYCGFTKCGRSHNAAWWARFMGYTQVYRMPGGITAWKDAGNPYKTIPQE